MVPLAHSVDYYACYVCYIAPTSLLALIGVLVESRLVGLVFK